LFCLVLLAAGYLLLRAGWEPEAALRWSSLAALAMGFVVWRLWHSLSDNFRPGENLLLPDLGAGNVISLVRGALIASLFGFLFSSWPPGWLAWLPGIIYTVAALLDGVDGIAARRSNQVTRLGETLDISFDGLGTLVVTALLAQYGQAPVWFVILGLARPIFLAGMWLRRRLGLPLYDLLPSNSRRMIAGFTFGFTFVLLWPLVKPPGTLWAASFWALPFLGGFLLDWLVVSGVLKPDYGASISGFTRFGTTWLPIFFRLSAVMLLSYGLLLNLMNDYSVPYLNPWQYFLANNLYWLQVVVVLALALGIAVRSFSLAGLFLLGLLQISTPLDLAQRILIYVYISLVFLGSGAYSFWRPEDRLIEHRIGEQPG
jgi:CDP-diacylglycerol--glycerol-3-phosphate 3-phosphatidyltransferase